jgi:hypothetical protein
MSDVVREIRIDECLWQNSMVQAGVLSEWAVGDGAIVEAGQGVATIVIEDAALTVRAAAGGRLTQVARVNAVLEPGDIIGRIVET